MIFTNISTHASNGQSKLESFLGPSCSQTQQSDFLTSGWYLWEPYLYQVNAGGKTKLSGMDVELLRSIAGQVEKNVKFDHLSWNQLLNGLKDGSVDVVSGASYTNARTEFVYFSIPYRSEENSLFMSSKINKTFNFSNIQEFLTQLRLQNFKLGVSAGSAYADDAVNEFIRNPDNEDIIVEYDDENANLEALAKGSIEGFIADRMVGSALAVNSSINNNIIEIPLNIATPIHFMFSKKTVPLTVVEEFNTAIANYTNKSEYKNTILNYLYPVLILQTINAPWFYIVCIVGAVAFAISGLAIGAKNNYSLFATLLIAMLPSVGGTIIRDLLIKQEELQIFTSPSYLYSIIIAVIFGYATIRLFSRDPNSELDIFKSKIWDDIIVIGDAFGQAAFISTGVTVAIMGKLEPILLWGPFLAFIASNSGVIIRDIIVRSEKNIIQCREINAEISVFWGFIFSVIIFLNSDSPDPEVIKYAVIVISLGAFASRLYTHYYQVPNIVFAAKKANETIIASKEEEQIPETDAGK